MFPGRSQPIEGNIMDLVEEEGGGRSPEEHLPICYHHDPPVYVSRTPSLEGNVSPYGLGMSARCNDEYALRLHDRDNIIAVQTAAIEQLENSIHIARRDLWVTERRMEVLRKLNESLVAENEQYKGEVIKMNDVVVKIISATEDQDRNDRHLSIPNTGSPHV